MEKLADALMGMPSSRTLSDAELSKQCNSLLVNHLYKVTASTFAAQGGDELLQMLDPSFNSLGYLYILYAKIEILGDKVVQALYEPIVSFLQVYDPRQVAHASREFRKLVETFTRFANDIGKAIAAVRPLKKAILRGNPSKFSFMHHLFARTCLGAMCYREALEVLDVDIFEFSGQKASGDPLEKGLEVTYQDVLSYFLYGAIIYMGVKNWRRALDLLSNVVAAPGTGCSAIQVEAYKKYMLVGLLLEGKAPPLPKSTPAGAVRVLRALVKPYESFASAFASRDANIFRQEIALTAEVFQNEGNAGLARQCIDAFRRKQIIALKNTYVTLGVDEIAQKNFDVSGRGGDAGGGADTERVILQMIERGEIRASLSQSHTDPAISKTTVHFDDGEAANDTTLDEAELHRQIERVVKLNAQVKRMDRRLGKSNEFITYLVKQAKGSVPPPAFVGADSDLMDFDYGSSGNAQWDEMDAEEAMQDLLDED